jgi:HEAT repeat protein
MGLQPPAVLDSDDPPAKLVLLDLLRDRRIVVRCWAIFYLGRNCSASSEEIVSAGLLQALKDPEPRVRRQAAHALAFARLPEAQIQPALLEALQDEDAEVRELASMRLRLKGR